jgi:hypothetical protein
MNKENLMNSWMKHIAPSSACSISEMEARVARFHELPKSPRAFADTYLPGHERTLFSVIGSGVTTLALNQRLILLKIFMLTLLLLPKDAVQECIGMIQRRFL